MHIISGRTSEKQHQQYDKRMCINVFKSIRELNFLLLKFAPPSDLTYLNRESTVICLAIRRRCEIVWSTNLCSRVLINAPSTLDGFWNNYNAMHQHQLCVHQLSRTSTHRMNRVFTRRRSIWLQCSFLQLMHATNRIWIRYSAMPAVVSNTIEFLLNYLHTQFCINCYQLAEWLSGGGGTQPPLKA